MSTTIAKSKNEEKAIPMAQSKTTSKTNVARGKIKSQHKVNAKKAAAPKKQKSMEEK